MAMAFLILNILTGGQEELPHISISPFSMLAYIGSLTHSPWRTGRIVSPLL
jgi:hypothetical protein